MCTGPIGYVHALPIASLEVAQPQATCLVPSSPRRIVPAKLNYMTVQGIMQHEQSSLLKHEHFPPCGLTMEPAVLEMDEAVEAGIFAELCGSSADV
jgi:hypothetical protein